MKKEDLPPFRPEYNGGVNHPRDHEGSLLPSSLAIEEARILKAAQALAEAQRNAPRKSFNTIERERLQDQANARAVGIQRSSWAG